MGCDTQVAYQGGRLRRRLESEVEVMIDIFAYFLRHRRRDTAGPFGLAVSAARVRGFSRRGRLLLRSRLPHSMTHTRVTLSARSDE